MSAASPSPRSAATPRRLSGTSPRLPGTAGPRPPVPLREEDPPPDCSDGSFSKAAHVRGRATPTPLPRDTAQQGRAGTVAGRLADDARGKPPGAGASAYRRRGGGAGHVLRICNGKHAVAVSRAVSPREARPHAARPPPASLRARVPGPLSPQGCLSRVCTGQRLTGDAGPRSEKLCLKTPPQTPIVGNTLKNVPHLYKRNGIYN